jgi:hypothetical protein
MAKYNKFLGLGIAGNFALHLDQAGEAKEFAHIMSEDEAAPKGMFPFFLPKQDNHNELTQTNAKEILSTYPLGADYIRLPKENVNVQTEPEVALICDLTYTLGRLTKIEPRYFGAFNDCSIRVEGAKKISDKKNWGLESKGFSNSIIKIDKFAAGGIMDNYSICSYLKRDGNIYQYGEDVELTGYSYFHEKLLDWMLNQINTQDNCDPLEPLSNYIMACDNPQRAIISIGATRYTEFGEKTFLQAGDESIIIVYDRTKISTDEVLASVKTSRYNNEGMSVLTQKVI